MIKGLKIYVYILSMQDLIIKLFLKRSVLHFGTMAVSNNREVENYIICIKNSLRISALVFLVRGCPFESTWILIRWRPSADKHFEI